MTYTPEPLPPEQPAAAYYPAPAYAPPPPKDLTTFGVLAFASAALATLLTAVSSTVVGRAVRSGGDRADDLDWSVAAYYAGSVLTFVALVGGFVTAGMWLHRARTNADVIAPGFHHARSAGWAWGGWVCPLVSLWFPFQVVRDVHRSVNALSVTPVIGWWWGLFLAAEISWRISDRVESNALSTGTGAAGAQEFSVVVSVLMVAALAAWGLVLRTVTRDQHDRMYGRTRAL